MSKQHLALLVLLVSASAFTIQQDLAPNDDRVKIDFFYESLCPYCQQFINGALKTAANTKDFWKICDFNLYPYGNAKRTKNGTSWSFTCQHGQRQCDGNLIETCAIKLNQNEFYTKALPFIICLESASSDWISQGKKCAGQTGISWDEIASCTASKQGNDWQNEMGQVTDKLQPAHTYVPWVVVNGQHSTNTESAVESNMVRYVCSVYKGTEKIAACGK